MSVFRFNASSDDEENESKPPPITYRPSKPTISEEPEVKKVEEKSSIRDKLQTKKETSSVQREKSVDKSSIRSSEPSPIVPVVAPPKTIAIEAVEWTPDEEMAVLDMYHLETLTPYEWTDYNDESQAIRKMDSVPHFLSHLGETAPGQPNLIQIAEQLRDDDDPLGVYRGDAR
jgi:hypothetical protein